MLKRISALFTLLFLVGIGSSYGTTIDYSTSDLGGGVWQYQYSVLNDTLTAPLQELTIYFDYGLYSNVAIPTPKVGWDEITADPALVLGSPQPGFYDALSLGGGIPVGGSESGFTVTFDWLGSGVPGSQYFEIPDTSDYSVLLDSGQTTAAAVPEPSVLLLLVSGCPALLLLKRKLLT
jgi:hypothetical protein